MYILHICIYAFFCKFNIFHFWQNIHTSYTYSLFLGNAFIFQPPKAAASNSLGPPGGE